MKQPNSLTFLQRSVFYQKVKELTVGAVLHKYIDLVAFSDNLINLSDMLMH